MFPLADADLVRGAPGAVQLEAELDTEGHLRGVRASQQPAARSTSRTTAAEGELQALIVDLGAAIAGEQLRELHFVLPSTVSGDYRAMIEIERSDDLRWWAPVAQSPLHWLSSRQGDQLRQDRVVLPLGSGRYLRISWLQGVPLLFEQIRGLWRTPLADRPAPLPELEMRFEGRPGAVAGDWVYAVPPALHAQQLALDLAEPNTVLPVGIGRYLPAQSQSQTPQQRAPRFQAQLRSTFYRLLHQGVERRSDLLGIAPFAASEWVVRPDPGVAIAGMLAPQLRLRWTPHTLLFTARGQGPYTLAVGAASAQVQRWPDGPQAVAQVAPGFSEDELRALPAAQFGTALPRPAADPPVLVAEADAADPKAAARARRYLLWAILGGGVLLLSVLCWRLFRQTQPTGPDGDGH